MKVWNAITRSGLFVMLACWQLATSGNEQLAPQKVFDFVDAGGNRPAVVSSVAMSRDGRWMAAGGDDHIVRVYDTQRLAQVQRLAEHRDWVKGVAFSPAGDRLVTVGNDHAHCVFCPQDGRLIEAVRDDAGPLRGVAFDPAADKFATVGFGTHAQVCSTTGEPRQQLDCPCRDTSAACISPDAAKLAVAGRNGIVRIFDLTGGTAPMDITADTRRIRAVEFSPDGTRVVVGGDGPDVKFFDASTGRELNAWPTRPAKVFCLCYLDSNHLAIGGTDNTIHIWNVASQTIERQLTGHTGTITSLACDATGRRLVSGSYDTTVRLWDLNPLAGNLAAEQTPATR